jgi:chromosome segregation ATPase
MKRQPIGRTHGQKGVSMVSFLKMFNGHREAALSEMRELAARFDGERASLDTLIDRAGRSADELGNLATPITEMHERFAAVERRMDEIEGRVPAIIVAQDQADALAETCGQMESRLADSERRGARIESQLDGVEQLVGSAACLKQDLARLLETGAGFRTLQADSDHLKTGIGAMAAGLAQLREGRDHLEQATKQAAARVQDIDESSQSAMRTINDCHRRVDELEQRIGGLAPLAAEASEARHQLLTLRWLAEQVTQKAAALENQRDALERYARNASHLESLAHRVDATIREQEQQMMRLQTLGGRVEEARSLCESVIASSSDIGARQQKIEERDRAIREKLTDLQAQLQRAADRFEVEHGGLEAASNRVADLRAGVAACEEHLQRLDPVPARVTALVTSVDGIWSRVGFLMSDVAHIEEQAKKTRALRADAYRVRDLLADMAARTAEIEKGKARLDEVVAGLSTLAGTHEAIKQALDTVRAAQDEAARARTSQIETAAWVTAVRGPVAELEERMRRLDAMRPTLESSEKRVACVVEMLDLVASRRHLVDELQSRLTELTALGVQLDDRSNSFRSQLDIAEGRFIMVARQAEDAERIADLITDTSRRVAAVDDRVGDLATVVASFEARAQDVEGLATRTEAVGREIGARQAALERATEHLASASKVREEAAAAVQLLEARLESVRTAVCEVDQRAERLETLSEDQSVALESVANEMAELEAQLEKWKLAKNELRMSLEQVTIRESTVEALKAHFAEMLDLADRIANEVKAAGEVHRDIERMHPTVDGLLRRLQDADAATAAVECRKHEIEHAERRLARAEAVLIDIQSSLETLHTQKASFDQVIEKAGALTFEVQQGEALIDRLRKERDVTNSVRIALNEAGSRNDARPGGLTELNTAPDQV